MMQPYGAGICRALVSTSLYAAPAAACKRLPDWDRVRPMECWSRLTAPSRDHARGAQAGRGCIRAAGASRAMGEDARSLRNEGAYIIITWRHEPELAAAVKEIGRSASFHELWALDSGVDIIARKTAGEQSHHCLRNSG